MTMPADRDMPRYRNILVPFLAVLVMSVAIISALTVIAARSQDRAAIESSVHLTRSVMRDIERRLADQLLDYSYWDEAVDNLVTRLNPDWADKNVGIYMHQRFQISTSFVIGTDDRAVYAMHTGQRWAADPLGQFSGGLRRMLAETRRQPPDQPPTPVTGILFDGELAHIAAASTLTAFASKTAPGARIATGSTLVFTRAIDAAMLAEMSGNYLLRDLRLVPPTATPGKAALPLQAFDGTLAGYLTWTPDALGRDLLAVLIPAISLAFLFFGTAAYIFYRRVRTITDELSRDNAALREAREELYMAKEDAEAANRTKSLFLANMSHELRTPLNSIIGFSEILKNRMYGPLGHNNYDTYAGNIWDAGRHLLDLINDILDVSKIEADELDMSETELDLAGLVESSITIIREQADRAGIILAMERQIDLPRLRGDEVRIRQVILNVLSNAVKFTPPGGTVTAAIEDAEGALVLRVSDTGIGIAEDDMPKVLAPFQQVRNDYALAGEGTGLGVHLSKRICELHGGSFDIASEIGAGTTVTITFPPERAVRR